MTLKAGLTGALSLALLAACEPGAVRTSHVYYNMIFPQDWFIAAASGRDLRVVIRGNPTQAPQEEFEHAVIAAMQGRNWGPETNFTTDPSESALKNFRVVMLFGGERYAGGGVICSDADTVDPALERHRVRLQAAFCVGTKPLTSLQVTIGGVASPFDVRLERMVAAAVVELFPPIDETRFDKCGGRLRGCG